MKPKLSPQEYQKTLKVLDLKSIFLSGLTVKLDDSVETKQLKLDIKEKCTFSHKGTELKNFYQYKFTAKNESGTGQFLGISCEYTVIYDLLEEVEITNEFHEIFNNFVLSMTLWPYFRELISNIISRMNMPPLVLPMKKL